ncbi:hypothetical protein COLO4_30552 [Corchorus olitorius]|uniref:non-specific serine/threonine protein kinase n=1 Tax=Corchorus olitorius TaxID=93759 RepID=A0A1R3H810_9ROSI|nr:hypothetical protein COLO4_30552 [Corchorus olitorius]
MVMEMFNTFFCLLIGGSVLHVLQVHAQDQSGFISLDCGISAASTYNDAITGIKYISDANFIDSGLSKSISPQFQTNTISQQFYSVRSFLEGLRNCYTLQPTQGKNNKYLIRASFMYGDYDDQSKPPEFDLHLGVNFWDSVKMENESSIVVKEIMYKDDPFDRIWEPQNFRTSKIISTSLTIDAQNNNGYQPAPDIMSTANTPINVSQPIIFYWEPTDSTAKYFVYMHFAEVEELKPNEIREFNVSYNGEVLYGSFEPKYLYTDTLYTTVPVSGDSIEFWLERTNRSTLPPILNGLEIFMAKDFSQSQADSKDVDAIMDIKSKYGVKRNWQGDPCAPKAYSWDGLNCSYEGSTPPRIISLNLSSSELTGEIANSISNLAMLQYLDLSNNSFTGKVPDFLSQMPSLTVLIFPAEGSSQVSTAVAGTPGYLDPEYQINHRLNEKSDVYSFGVVLLEIVTSRPVISKSYDEIIHISQWVNSLLAKGEIKRIVDPNLGGEFEINSAWKIVELALACSSWNSSDRPTMSEVVVELKECLKKEVARRREGPAGTRSNGPREGISINIDTEPSPIAR